MGQKKGQNYPQNTRKLKQLEIKKILQMKIFGLYDKPQKVFFLVSQQPISNSKGPKKAFKKPKYH